MHVLDLTGKWNLAWCDAGRGLNERGRGEEMDPTWYFEAEVPGEVHLDMMRAGMIEDPRVGSNVLKARWIETVLWSYRKHFEAPEEALNARCWIYLEGVDLSARVFLNGEEVGSHCNVFYPCRVEVTGKLQPGTNRLVVQVDSGLLYGVNKPMEGLSNKLSDVMTKRNWLRKPQFQAQWDWAARMLNVGLGGPVRLEWTAEPVRADQFVPLVTMAEDLKSARVEARWHVEGLGDEEADAEMTVAIPELGIEQKEKVRIEPGVGQCALTLDVQNPELWWPIGHGAPRRYEIKVTLCIDGKNVAETAQKIGFRRVVVKQDPHPDGGTYFTFEINNRKVFCKGGNWVPADMIYSAVDRERTERLIDLGIEANFNMLRIWGGGLYETEDFYELCDEKGVLVWQEFIFACAKYPGNDEDFHNDFIREATWNVRRLAGHPSLIIWCGNNEMEQANWDWPGYQEGTMFPDHAIFHFTLPQLMAREDPTRFYWPSSPFSPNHESPNANHTGDQHPWILGFADTEEGMNFHRFRALESRFPNEGGFLGPNSLPTALACLDRGEERMHSFSWRLHDNTMYNDACRFWLGRERADMTVEEYVYWGGLLQGEALREYCDSFRSKMYTCSSAIFWMYNDCWPCSRSWTIVDYYFRYTPSFHPVRRAMAPVNVALAEKDGEIIVYGINDTLDPVKASLQYGIFELAGNYAMDETIDVELAPNASTPLARFSADQWIARERSMCFCVLRDADGSLIARNKLYQGFWKDMVWPEAKVNVRVENDEAVFRCDVFALGVSIDLDGEKKLPDNFFDLYPGMEYRIPWSESNPPEIKGVGNLPA
ncbi:MAG: beta-mannosidase [Candidatus Sumerlaeia bacterium]